MSTEKNPFNELDLRSILYIVMISGIANILTSFEIFHKHEAFLVSGGLALLAVLLLEPRKERFRKGLIMSTVVVSVYGLMLKLPMMLMGKLNYYLVYFIAYMLLAIVNLGAFAIPLKYRTSKLS